MSSLAGTLTTEEINFKNANGTRLTVKASPTLTQDTVIYLPLANVGTGLPEIIHSDAAAFTPSSRFEHQIVILTATTPRTVTLPANFPPNYIITIVDGANALMNPITTPLLTLNKNGAAVTYIKTTNAWLIQASFQP